MASNKPATDAKADREPNPDLRPLNGLQAQRLAAITGLNAKELAGQTVAQLSDKLRWRVDPELFFFRKVCGQVVKKDPVSGIEYPVPFATVIVEDTDCSLLGYFPKQWRWGWFFPLNCRREVLATVKTDKCGHFCVYVPRFDIDWILRWRHERICFPDIFKRPSRRDLIEIPELRQPFPPRPGPGPDPAPDLSRFARSFGARVVAAAPGLDRRAFAADMPPPLPLEFQHALTNSTQVVASKDAKAIDAVRGAIAAQLGVKPGMLERLDLGRFQGPFRRCIDIVVPEWHLVFDTPDITFRVTQDTNGDGVEETIYSEGYFDVRWNAGAIPPVTLLASSAAIESRQCETPVVPCKDVPEIVFAGLMPLTDAAYFNVTEGYALRPNRPVGPPLPPAARPPAKTPFLGTLQLYGCVNVPKAEYYRVLLSADNGVSFAAVTGLAWKAHPFGAGAIVNMTPDPSGWYKTLANPDDYLEGHMVLEWPTPTLGKYLLKIEVADIGKAPLPLASNVVAIQTDNTVPDVHFTKLAWRFEGDPDTAFDLPGHDLLVPCPTIRRGAPARSIEVQFDVSVAAHHLRNTELVTSGCGAGAFTAVALPAPAETSHWHQTVVDNAVLLSGRYRLDALAHEGAYGFACFAASRAMNPAGSDNGHLDDWLYDPLYAYTQPSVEVAIVNG